MKLSTYIHGVRLAAALAALCLLSACQSGDVDDANQMLMRYIDIHVHPTETSVNSMTTRGPEGILPSVLQAEDYIYDVQVWAFVSGAADNATAIGYVERLSTTPLADGDVLKMPFFTTDIDVANLQVDFYAVANVKAVNSASRTLLDKGRDITKAELASLLLTGDDFGTTTLVHEVPATGLPMSKIITNKQITQGAGALSITRQDIPMRRAVSKIRFCVARQSGLTGAQVLGFTLGDQLISANEYLFPNDNPNSAHLLLAGSDATDYVAGFTYSDSPLIQDMNIPSMTSPESFVFSTWMATNSSSTLYDYDEDITTNTAQYGLTYLRETGKKLTGTLRYSLDGGATEATVPFTMATEGDFARNHSYIVYVYFSYAGVNLTVTTQPWELVEHTTSYTKTPTVTEAGKLRPVAGTYPYDGINYETKRVRLLYQTDLKFTFKVEAPVGYAWTATFNSLTGNPQAFRFVDDEGNLLDHISGDIGEDATLTIRPIAENVDIESSAEIVIVARNLMGTNVVLSGEDLLGKWVVIQQANL